MASGSGTGTPITSTLIVTVAESKADLRYTASDKDTYIEGLIAIATELASEHQGHKYLTTACVDYLDAWPSLGVIVPRYSPLVTVASIGYVDTAGAAQTWSDTEYDVDAAGFIGRITPAYGYSFPSVRSQMNAITITYTAGYGDAAADTPEIVKAAVRMAVYRWFHGLSDLDASLPALPQAALDLLGYNRKINV